MADKLLVAISARQVSVAIWHRRRFNACDVFVHNEDGLAQFSAFLAKLRRMSVHIMVDAVEEDYRVESLPHSFGADRRDMLNRKLKQHYRTTPYYSARLQGRDTSKRRDDRYLFCALTNPELIAGWVQAVSQHNLPIAGIYLLPTVTQALVDKLQIKEPNLLVVSNDSAGLRLTCFRDQKLRISRLARVEASGQLAIKNYADEISNTRLYLHALRIVTLDERLLVLVVDRNDTRVELAQAIGRDNPNLPCRRLGRQEILSTLGLAARALDSSTEAMDLHLLGLAPPENNLAPPLVTVGYRLHQARRGIYALTGVTALAAAVWGAVTVYQILDTRSDIEATRLQTAELQARYQEATRQFPAAPTTAENLKRAVEISQKIAATTRSPEFIMDMLSRALERHPTIVLRTFGWKYDRTDIDPDINRTGKPAPAIVPGAPTGATAPAGRRQSALVEGEVRPFRGDYRFAIEEINRFAETLSQQPEVAEVKVVKLPLNINTDLTMSGNTTENPEQSGRADFKLVLALKQS